MSQMTFSDYEYSCCKKKTKREEFLDVMEDIIPWDTFAVRAIEIPEFDIKSLSEILGHKNVSFTLNVYGSANMQQKVKCMNLLNDLL